MIDTYYDTWEYDVPVVADEDGNWWPLCGEAGCDLHVFETNRAGCSGLCNGLEGWPYQEEERR